MVSIITPCYNSAEFIASTIDSVIAQTFYDWEMLIIDDCSTDGSGEIINRYAEMDSRIKCLKTECNSGVAGARNIGVGMALGRYIAYLDSDDIWTPDKLEIDLNTISANKEAALVFSYYQKISEFGEKIGSVVKSSPLVDYKHLLKSNIIACSSVMYDTDMVGKFFHEEPRDDYATWLKILKQGNVAVNTKSLTLLYRIREGSLSRNKIKATIRTYRMYRDVEKLSVLVSLGCIISQSIHAFVRRIV